MEKENNMLEMWLDFRYESLSKITDEDKNFNTQIQTVADKIMFHKNNETELQDGILDLLDKYSSYSSYLSERYYKAGFKDATKLFFNISHNKDIG